MKRVVQDGCHTAAPERRPEPAGSAGDFGGEGDVALGRRWPPRAGPRAGAGALSGWRPRWSRTSATSARRRRGSSWGRGRRSRSAPRRWRCRGRRRVPWTCSAASSSAMARRVLLGGEAQPAPGEVGQAVALGAGGKGAEAGGARRLGGEGGLQVLLERGILDTSSSFSALFALRCPGAGRRLARGAAILCDRSRAGQRPARRRRARPSARASAGTLASPSP